MQSILPSYSAKEAFVLAGIVGAAALAGWLLAAGLFGVAPVFAVGAFAALLLAVRGRVRYVLVLGLVATGFVHPEYQPSVSTQFQADVRVFDVLMLLLVGVVGVYLALGRLSVRAWLRALGQYGPLWVWLAVVGVSMGVVALTIPDRVGTAVVAYLRVLATAALIGAVPLAVRTRRQLHGIVWFMVVCSVITILLALLQRVGVLHVGQINPGRLRVGGLVGINAMGMPSGFTGLWGVMLLFRPRPRRLLGAFLIVWGMLGLALAASISSALAFAVATGTYAVRHTRVNMLAPVKLAFIGLLVVGGIGYFLVTFRARDLRGLNEFSTGSSAHRAMLAYAAFQLFLKHPVTGVGWQGSATPTHMGSPELGTVLRARFPNMPTFYFPDATVTTAHNFYMQMLAETGLIGILTLGWAIFSLRQRVRRIVGQLHDPPVREAAEFFQYAALVVLIWWNTNPLYGGQTETIFISGVLGGLLAARQLAPDHAQPAAADDRGTGGRRHAPRERSLARASLPSLPPQPGHG